MLLSECSCISVCDAIGSEGKKRKKELFHSVGNCSLFVAAEI